MNAQVLRWRALRDVGAYVRLGCELKRRVRLYRLNVWFSWCVPKRVLTFCGVDNATKQTTLKYSCARVGNVSYGWGLRARCAGKSRLRPRVALFARPSELRMVAIK